MSMREKQSLFMELVLAMNVNISVGQAGML